MFQTTQNNNIFRLLFQGISEGVLVVNENQIIVEVNDALTDMFGYSTNELKGMHLNTLIPTHVHAKHDTYFKKFIAMGKSRKMGIGMDLFGIKKDGNKFPVEAGLNPFSVSGKNYVMTILTDITLRKKSEQEIKELNNELETKIEIRTEELKNTVQKLQSNNQVLEDEIAKRKKAEAKIKTALNKERELGDLKTKFLSLVSHEFKTPLSGILTSATLIGKYELTEQQDKRNKHIKTIKNKVHYLTNILNDFLSIERLESGKVTYKFEEFSLQTLINEVIYNANVTLKSGQKINYPNPIEDCLLHQDKNVMELVLSNLLSNAIKYSPEDTSIDFRISQDEQKIHFEVEDQGMGIPKKDQKHIFERYFRAENAINNQGTGIGLNIAKVHLENLGGKIYYISEENKGTTFYVEIPKKHG
ncbi:MAG: PAS domain-containing sensor histidine kinase [Flavobacteriaceae bacterium]|nr:PAS domain-containing sensor histidine kinase [Flavobacteriaceae bacterium]